MCELRGNGSGGGGVVVVVVVGGGDDGAEAVVRRNVNGAIGAVLHGEKGEVRREVWEGSGLRSGEHASSNGVVLEFCDASLTCSQEE